VQEIDGLAAAGGNAGIIKGTGRWPVSVFSGRGAMIAQYNMYIKNRARTAWTMQ